MVNVDTRAGGCLAQEDRLGGPKVSIQLVWCYIHRLNQVNARNGCATMTAP